MAADPPGSAAQPGPRGAGGRAGARASNRYQSPAPQVPGAASTAGNPQTPTVTRAAGGAAAQKGAGAHARRTQRERSGAERRGGHLVPAVRRRTRDLAVPGCKVAGLRPLGQAGFGRAPPLQGRGVAPLVSKLARQPAEPPGRLVKNANCKATPLGILILGGGPTKSAFSIISLGDFGCRRCVARSLQKSWLQWLPGW